MKTFATIATLASSLAFASAATADTLIAYWNFNDFDTSDANIAADAGSGNLNMTGWGGPVQSFAGSTENALFDDEAGGSLSLQGGSPTDGIFPGNNTFIDFEISMAGFQDLEISYWTRRTGTGFDSNQWSYSINGVDFIDFGPEIDPDSSTAGEVIVMPTLTGANDAASVTLRYTLDGATSNSGNNRIDNVQINATLIPAPGALALLGLAGAIGTTRRRRG